MNALLFYSKTNLIVSVFSVSFFIMSSVPMNEAKNISRLRDEVLDDMRKHY